MTRSRRTTRRVLLSEPLEARQLLSATTCDSAPADSITDVAAEPTTYSIGDTNRDGRVDVGDIDHLVKAIAAHETHAQFDLNADRLVNRDDVVHLVEEVLGTTYGDANLDGLFNADDLVQVFQAGDFNRDFPSDVSWSEGDWTGDRLFNHSDLILAFQTGSYLVWSDDRSEENDTLATASDLGSLEETLQMDDLRLLDRQDWYRFRIDGAGTAASHVTIDFSHEHGNLELRLYGATGRLVGESATSADRERISLNHLSAGEFFVQVYGHDRSSNLDYSLQIDPGQDGRAEPGNTLWLNFDGVSIHREDLLRWSTDWELSVSGVDPERNGVQVAPFLHGTRGWSQREDVISRLMGHVQQDLAPYGIQVQRTHGLAAEDQGETTIFVGDNPVGHRAGDVDFGNDNRTDIAFVTDEWWGSVNDTALALADVVLHEAGHTFGLYHVYTAVGRVVLPESMGLRYSEPDPSRWVQDTSFMDRTFIEFWNHGGGRGSQNAHQTMLRNFGFASAASPTQIVRYEITTDGAFSLTTSAEADTVVAQQTASGDVELLVNDQAFQLGTGIRQIRLHTEGDARDRVVLANDLAIEMVVDRSVLGNLVDLGKSVSRSTSRVTDGEGVPEQACHPSALAVDIVLSGLFDEPENQEQDDVRSRRAHRGADGWRHRI